MIKSNLRPAVAISFVVLFVLTTLTAAGQQAVAPAPRQETPTARATANTRIAPLMIGGATFRIGMSRQEVMRLLADCCHTPALSSPSDSIFVQSKINDEILGSIFFKDDRVSGLRLDIKQSQNKDVAEFILNLYRTVLDGQTLLQPTAVTLTAFPQEGGNFTGRHLLLTLPNGRRLRLEQSTLDDGRVIVQLQEER